MNGRRISTSCWQSSAPTIPFHRAVRIRSACSQSSAALRRSVREPCASGVAGGKAGGGRRLGVPGGESVPTVTSLSETVRCKGDRPGLNGLTRLRSGLGRLGGDAATGRRSAGLVGEAGAPTSRAGGARLLLPDADPDDVGGGSAGGGTGGDSKARGGGGGGTSAGVSACESGARGVAALLLIDFLKALVADITVAARFVDASAWALRHFCTLATSSSFIAPVLLAACAASTFRTTNLSAPFMLSADLPASLSYASIALASESSDPNATSAQLTFPSFRRCRSVTASTVPN